MPESLTLVSLFTGVGGLDLGLEAAGFKTRLCVEIDEDARKTLSLNRPKWKLAEPGDVHQSTPSSLLTQAGLKPRELTLVAAGPPCQPFSKAAYWSNGKTRRLKDPRASTLSAFLKFVDVALPKVLLLENVKGFAFNGKDEALRLLQNEITQINIRRRTRYQLQVVHINAASFGVPQMRERIFVIANIYGRKIEPLKPTHGKEKGILPYITAWDAIGDLDKDTYPEELKVTGRWADLLPSIPEGKNYLWHTDRNSKSGAQPFFGWRTRYWSFLLKLAKNHPSWTIQAEPGPATGPFHWKSRLLSVKELCRLQTFPKGYKIHGDRRSAHRQIGNAVPSAIGELLGLEIRRQLLNEEVRDFLQLIPTRRRNCPSPETPQRAPRKYFILKGRYEEHPGVGLGPGRQDKVNLNSTRLVAFAP